jgi:phospholipid/cholesterol/gamma-HCH transport system substrate-binding protein
MRKETKIAIFSIITLALAIWGYKYLLGFNLFSKKSTLYAVFERVDGLRVSTPIYIHGLEVGLVADFEQAPEDLNKIVVEMQINKDIKIPKTAVAENIANSFMGGTTVNLVFEGTCQGNDCAGDGDRIRGITKGMLASMATPEEVGIYMDALNQGLQKMMDTLSGRVSESPELRKGIDDVEVTLANLRSTTTRLDQLMATSSGSIQTSIKNIEKLTATLSESNQHIKNIIANAEVLSTDLRDAEIKSFVGDTRQTVKQLQSTLATSEKAIADLNLVLQDFKSGEGALPMLLNDKDFAQDLDATVQNLDHLLRDIRLHPERYRRILSKKKMEYEYTAPESDPAFQKN